MSSIAITGGATGTGVFSLVAPSTSTNRTLTLPDVTGTVLSTASTSVVTPAMLTQPLTAGTAVASTSGTSIDFTSIPSWVKRITVMFDGVSSNGSSNMQVQLGSGSVTTSGYLAYWGYVTSTTNIQMASGSAGFGLWNGGGGDLHYMHMTLTKISGNTWVSSQSGAFWNGSVTYILNGGGSIALGGALDRVRITTVNGTDAFDAGSLNILYEG